MTVYVNCDRVILKKTKLRSEKENDTARRRKGKVHGGELSHRKEAKKSYYSEGEHRGGGNGGLEPFSYQNWFKEEITYMLRWVQISNSSYMDVERDLVKGGGERLIKEG